MGVLEETSSRRRSSVRQSFGNYKRRSGLFLDYTLV